MMRSMQIIPDVMGRTTSVLEPPATAFVVQLQPGVPRQIDLPDGAVRVLFSATGPFWVSYDGPAALPQGDILDGGAPELSPAARGVAGLTQLGLVAPAACTVGLTFYR